VAARVLGVLDGDTLLVRARIWLGQEVETLVRVAGVDAPEMRSACAAERALAERARDFVVRLVGEREVQLRDVRYDKYGRRVVARVEAGGTDVAAALVAAGLGRPYAGKSRGAWCDPADGR
jgi:endonuclease YncB( thermonuclease family)